MTRTFTTCSLVAAVAGVAGLTTMPAMAAVVADGSLGADTYGPILFTQDTPTGFGDNIDPSVNAADGSEIDGVYSVVDGGNLNILVTGNLQTNFNRLVLYIDSVAGGQNTLTATTGGAFNDYSGIIFDTGFTADYGLILNGGGGGVEYFLDFAVVGTSSTFLGGSGVGNTTIAGSNGTNVGINQSNILGVTANDAPFPSVALAGAVSTGLEFAIPLSELGNPPGNINIAGFIAGGNFLSNQVIGGVAGAPNLGSTPADFNQFAGNQFVTVAVPEPASLVLVGLGGLLIASRRRQA